MDELIRRDQKGIYSAAISGKINNIVGIDIQYDKPINCSLWIDNNIKSDLNTKVKKIINLIKDNTSTQ
jgi:adenylylsulfate kinase